MADLLSRLSLRTAGESHGPAMVAVLEGLPRGLVLDLAVVDDELRRRQGGAGRGGRQRLEHDRVEVLAGIRRGRTIGSPLCLRVENRDHSIDELPEPVRPRPGHADLAGCYRYLDHDIRSTLERASARETCARVAAGAVARLLLAQVGVDVFGFVRAVGAARLEAGVPGRLRGGAGELAALRQRRDTSDLYTLDPQADAAMLAEVQEAGRQRTTVGGLIEVCATGLLPGLGSCEQWHERLDARLGAALMSIPAIKGVELGDAFEVAAEPGRQTHDPIEPQQPGDRMVRRSSNRAGGLEGGMTNGEPLLVRAAMKPIATQRHPLPSVDLATGAAADSGYERSDICAVSAASVVAEAMVALVLADAVLRRVGGESMAELVDRSEVVWRAVTQLAGGHASGRVGPVPGTGSVAEPDRGPDSRPDTGPAGEE